VAGLGTLSEVGRRTDDGSAGDADYGQIGGRYARFRQPDPRIAQQLHAALGSARTVLNVGAGAGSYEPTDRLVTAVEPSATMRAQRPGGRPVAIDARAEALPFGDSTFDAAMTTFSVHQWSDVGRGLGELRRVARGPVAVLTGDPRRLDRFWLQQYAPEVIEVEARRYPPLDVLAEGLGATVVTAVVPVPLDCRDGFNEAYYGRPDALLDPRARQACSAWSFVDQAVHRRFADRLRGDLESGEWDRRYGHLRTQATFEGSLVLMVSSP
jgi:SAM-dependent methyltransferase